MPNTIAEIIKESEKVLCDAVGSPVNTNASLFDQAKFLLARDRRDFQRLGTNFLILRSLYDSLNVKFNDFLAEPLLKEGSLLLDRCLQERKEYQDLHAKWFEACVQIDEMFRLNTIAETELAELDAIQSQILDTEKTSLAHQRKTADESLLSFQKVKEHRDTETLLLERTVRMAAIANLMINERRDGPINSDDFETYGESSFKLFANGARKPIEIQRGSEKFNLDLEEAQYSNIRQTLDDAFSKISYEIKLKDKNVEFKHLRNEVSRLMAIRRAMQLTKENGALNFFEQMKPIKERFRNDLVSAYLRLEAAHEGFKKLYGREYEDRIGAFPQRNNIADEDLGRPELTDFPKPPPKQDFWGKLDFDKLVTWCQLANTWLASFLEKQQQVTRSFSLKSLMNDADFEAGKAHSEWRFRLTEDHLPLVVKKVEGSADETIYSQYIRLRSFAVQIDSGNDSGSWNIAITPPTHSIIRQNQGIENIVQSVGTLFLGRIYERTYAVVPEGAAPARLFNASPIGANNSLGDWVVSVIADSTSGASVRDIRDIDIHLTVALV